MSNENLVNLVNMVNGENGKENLTNMIKDVANNMAKKLKAVHPEMTKEEAWRAGKDFTFAYLQTLAEAGKELTEVGKELDKQ